MDIIKSIGYFILAGLCEIGGGYLMWLSIREGKSFWFAIAGAVILVLYGVVATLQPADFGRVYAAYGGFFIVMSVLWAYKFDNFTPDRFDIIGVCVIMVGVFLIYYIPRK